MERAEGSPGKRTPNFEEPSVPAGEPDMPAGLTAPEKKLWRETITILSQTPGLLTIADGSVIADYCYVCVELVRLARAKRVSEKLAVKQAKAIRKKILAEPDKEKRKAALLEWQAVYADMGKVAESASRGYDNRIDKLLHRKNVLRREMGLTASARSSIRITGSQGPGVDPEDEAAFTRGPRRGLVAV